MGDFRVICDLLRVYISLREIDSFWSSNVNGTFGNGSMPEPILGGCNSCVAGIWRNFASRIVIFVRTFLSKSQGTHEHCMQKSCMFKKAACSIHILFLSASKFFSTNTTKHLPFFLVSPGLPHQGTQAQPGLVRRPWTAPGRSAQLLGWRL